MDDVAGHAQIHSFHVYAIPATRKRTINNHEVEEVKKVKEEELQYFISYTSSTFFKALNKNDAGR
jgi:hypothetical protein